MSTLARFTRWQNRNGRALASGLLSLVAFLRSRQGQEMLTPRAMGDTEAVECPLCLHEQGLLWIMPFFS